MQAPLRTFPWEGRWQLTDINNVYFSLYAFSLLFHMIMFLSGFLNCN